MKARSDFFCLLKKYALLPVIIFCFSLSPWLLPGEEPIDGREVLRKVISSFARVKTIQAIFFMLDESGERMKGLLRYSHPGKLRLDFSEPPGKKIITNGKYLWIYDEKRKVAGRQNLFENSLSSGLAFLKWYKQISVIQQLNGFQIELKSPKQYWKNITIQTTKDYFPFSIKMENGAGNTKIITFKDIKTGHSFMGKVFDFRIPGSAQLIENPLNMK